MSDYPVALDQFIMRAEKVEGSNFWKWLRSPKGPFDLERFGQVDWLAQPGLNRDELDAFCLHLRLLVSNQDGFSILQIKNIAAAWPPEYEIYAKAIEQEVQYLNSALDKESLIQVHEPPHRTTSRDVFTIIFYGGLVHENVDKRADYRRLVTSGAFSYFVFRDFAAALHLYRQCILNIAHYLSHYIVARRGEASPALSGTLGKSDGAEHHETDA